MSRVLTIVNETGCRSYFDFYARQPTQTFGQPPAAHGPPGVPGGVPGGAPGTQGPPGVGLPATSTITINFDQLVAATPYFQ